jgi:hypothetical protein
LRTCKVCRRGQQNRILRRKIADTVLSQIGVYPYHCSSCNTVTYGWEWGRSLFLAALMLAMLTAGVALRLKTRPRFPVPSRRTAAAAPLPADGSYLTNDDIGRMGRVSMSAIIMNRLIRSQPHHFRIDPKSLISLKGDGVPDEVLLSMVEVSLDEPMIGAPADGPASTAALEAARLTLATHRRAR